MASRTQCTRALELFEDRLSRLDNVVGLGVVPAREGRSGAAGRDMALAVYVNKKLPIDQLAPDDVVPPVLKIRGRGKDVHVSTRIIEIGNISFEPSSR